MNHIQINYPHKWIRLPKLSIKYKYKYSEVEKKKLIWKKWKELFHLQYGTFQWLDFYFPGRIYTEGNEKKSLK